MDEETLNMYKVGDTENYNIHGRLKPQVVVTPEWYEDIRSFLFALQFLADGIDREKGTPIEKDLRLKQILIEHDMDNFHKWAEPLYYPIGGANE